MRLRPAALALLTLTACRVSMSPLQNRLAPGEEPFAVFVATGEAGQGDLFAVRAAGGATFPITYTRVREMAPALSPTGTDLAFIRETVAGDASTRRVVVMNLLNGRERMLPQSDLPADAVAWSEDAGTLYLRTAGSTLAIPAPPAAPQSRPLDSTESLHAYTLFDVLLGTPAFGRALDCPEGGVCVRLASGEESVLAADGRGAVRWGSDSVGYFVGAGFVVRPLGPGRLRELRLTPPRMEPRELTFYPGPAGQGPQ